MSRAVDWDVLAEEIRDFVRVEAVDGRVATIVDTSLSRRFRWLHVGFVIGVVERCQRQDAWGVWSVDWERVKFELLEESRRA